MAKDDKDGKPADKKAEKPTTTVAQVSEDIKVVEPILRELLKQMESAPRTDQLSWPDLQESVVFAKMEEQSGQHAQIINQVETHTNELLALTKTSDESKISGLFVAVQEIFSIVFHYYQIFCHSKNSLHDMREHALKNFVGDVRKIVTIVEGHKIGLDTNILANAKKNLGASHPPVFPLPFKADHKLRTDYQDDIKQLAYVPTLLCSIATSVFKSVENIVRAAFQAELAALYVLPQRIEVDTGPYHEFRRKLDEVSKYFTSITTSCDVEIWALSQTNYALKDRETDLTCGVYFQRLLTYELAHPTFILLHSMVLMGPHIPRQTFHPEFHKITQTALDMEARFKAVDPIAHQALVVTFLERHPFFKPFHQVGLFLTPMVVAATFWLVLPLYKVILVVLRKLGLWDLRDERNDRQDHRIDKLQDQIDQLKEDRTSLAILEKLITFVEALERAQSGFLKTILGFEDHVPAEAWARFLQENPHLRHYFAEKGTPEEHQNPVINAIELGKLSSPAPNPHLPLQQMLPSSHTRLHSRDFGTQLHTVPKAVHTTPHFLGPP